MRAERDIDRAGDVGLQVARLLKVYKGFSGLVRLPTERTYRPPNLKRWRPRWRLSF